MPSSPTPVPDDPPVTTLTFFRTLSGSSDDHSCSEADADPESDTCIVCLEPVGPDVTPASSTSSLYLPLLDDARVFLSDTPMPPPCACKYHAHPACLAEWYQRHPTCPVCRVSDESDERGDTDTPRTSSLDVPTWIEELRASSRHHRDRFLSDSEIAEGNTCFHVTALFLFRVLCLSGALGILYMMFAMPESTSAESSDV